MLTKRSMSNFGVSSNEFEDIDYDYTLYNEEMYLDSIDPYDFDDEYIEPVVVKRSTVVSEEFMNNLQKLCDEFHKLPEDIRRKELSSYRKR